MPVTLTDEQAAEQETDYINHIVMERNRGFEVLYTWFKDALLSKNGYVKVYFEEYEERETERYKGLTDAQLTMLAKDEDIEILEHESYIDQAAYEAAQQMFAQQMQQYQMQAQPQQQGGMPPQGGQMPSCSALIAAPETP